MLKICYTYLLYAIYQHFVRKRVYFNSNLDFSFSETESTNADLNWNQFRLIWYSVNFQYTIKCRPWSVLRVSMVTAVPHQCSKPEANGRHLYLRENLECHTSGKILSNSFRTLTRSTFRHVNWPTDTWIMITKIDDGVWSFYMFNRLL
jgi:hypothetical protein